MMNDIRTQVTVNIRGQIMFYSLKKEVMPGSLEIVLVESFMYYDFFVNLKISIHKIILLDETMHLL